jgi:hypothetical protein
MNRTNLLVFALISGFVIGQFFSIENAFSVICSADYSNFEDIYEIEEIVTLDPFLASSSIDAAKQLITVSVNAFLLSILFFCAWNSRAQFLNGVPVHFSLQPTRLWLRNRTMLL